VGGWAALLGRRGEAEMLHAMHTQSAYQLSPKYAGVRVTDTSTDVAPNIDLHVNRCDCCSWSR